MTKTLLALSAVSALFATTAAQAQGATYAIDPTHTFVTFEIDHFGTSTNRGRFDKKTGTVQFDKAGKKGSVDITIETGSINTGTGRPTQRDQGSVPRADSDRLRAEWLRRPLGAAPQPRDGSAISRRALSARALRWPSFARHCSR